MLKKLHEFISPLFSKNITKQNEHMLLSTQQQTSLTAFGGWHFVSDIYFFLSALTFFKYIIFLKNCEQEHHKSCCRRRYCCPRGWVVRSRAGGDRLDLTGRKPNNHSGIRQLQTIQIISFLAPCFFASSLVFTVVPSEMF